MGVEIYSLLTVRSLHSLLLYVELDETVLNLFKIYLINNKCVSTIPDECKGVGLEISANSKQEAIDS